MQEKLSIFMCFLCPASNKILVRSPCLPTVPIVQPYVERTISMSLKIRYILAALAAAGAMIAAAAPGNYLG